MTQRSSASRVWGLVAAVRAIRFDSPKRAMHVGGSRDGSTSPTHTIEHTLQMTRCMDRQGLHCAFCDHSKFTMYLQSKGFVSVVGVALTGRRHVTAMLNLCLAEV